MSGVQFSRKTLTFDSTFAANTCAMFTVLAGFNTGRPAQAQVFPQRLPPALYAAPAAVFLVRSGTAPPCHGRQVESSVKRLFSVNEPLNAEHAAVLKLIAAGLDAPLDAVYIGGGVSGPAVFYVDRQGNEGTRCVCAVNSPFWQAQAEAAALLSRL